MTQLHHRLKDILTGF